VEGNGHLTRYSILPVAYHVTEVNTAKPRYSASLHESLPSSRQCHKLWPTKWRHIGAIHLYSSDRMRLKSDGTSAETRFRLSAKRTSPFRSAGASVQSTTGSRGMRISGSNAGYTMFRGSVKSTGYPLHSQVSPSLSLPCVTVPSHFNWILPVTKNVHISGKTVQSCAV